jgi:hypothetical protein
MNSSERPTFNLTIRAMPGNYRADAWIRLRALVKACRRGYGYVLLDCREVKQPEQQPTAIKAGQSVSSTQGEAL